MRFACRMLTQRCEASNWTPLWALYSKVMRALVHIVHAHFITWIVKALYISISGCSVFPLANRRRLTMAYSITPLPIHRVHWAANESEASGGNLLLAIVSSVRCTNKVWSHSSQPIYSLKSSSPAWHTHIRPPTMAGLHT